MLTKITARHFDLTPELRAKADEEFDKLERFFENIVSAEMVLDVERHRRLAEVRAKVSRDVITGTGQADDMLAAIAMAMDKVKAQLKKHKERLKEKDPGQITSKEQRATRPKTDPEAVDQ